jgi:hypothetical protein
MNIYHILAIVLGLLPILGGFILLWVKADLEAALIWLSIIIGAAIFSALITFLIYLGYTY